jgi:hypothetical protein
MGCVYNSEGGPIGPIYYTPDGFFTAVTEATFGVPIAAFLIGAVALWVGRWVAKGFRPSQHQAGE